MSSAEPKEYSTDHSICTGNLASGFDETLPPPSVVLIMMPLSVIPEMMLTMTPLLIASNQQKVRWIVLFGRNMVTWGTTSRILPRKSSTNLYHVIGILFNYYLRGEHLFQYQAIGLS